MIHHEASINHEPELCHICKAFEALRQEPGWELAQDVEPVCECAICGCTFPLAEARIELDGKHLHPCVPQARAEGAREEREAILRNAKEALESARSWGAVGEYREMRWFIEWIEARGKGGDGDAKAE